jgi:hypothetical protein
VEAAQTATFALSLGMMIKAFHRHHPNLRLPNSWAERIFYFAFPGAVLSNFEISTAINYRRDPLFH